MKVLLTDIADGVGGVLQFHIETSSVHILNFQGECNLRVVGVGIFAREDATVVDVVEKNVGTSPRTAEDVDAVPYDALNFVLVKNLNVHRAIGGYLHRPTSLAVSYGMERNVFTFNKFGIDQRRSFSLSLARQLEIHRNSVGRHLRLRRQ